MTTKLTKQQQEDTGHGYWMYRDGYSYWGLALYRENDLPIECTKAWHDNPDTKAKQGWYAEQHAKMLIDRKAAEDASK